MERDPKALLWDALAAAIETKLSELET